MENYCQKVIAMNGPVASTCEVIEWIMEHGCPELDFTQFYWAKSNTWLTVSRENWDDDDAIIFRHPKVKDWHEPVKGAKRYYDGFNWWVYVGGLFYRMT